MKIVLALIVCLFPSLALSTLVELQVGYETQCGEYAGGKLCPKGICCSWWGYCGTSYKHCGPGCQSQCELQLIPSNPYVSESSSSFGNVRTMETHKMELATFVNQTLHAILVNDSMTEDEAIHYFMTAISNYQVMAKKREEYI